MIFEQQNNLDSALYYSRKNHEIILKINSNVSAIETHQKYISTFLEASKKELIIAEQTIKLKNRQIIIIVIILVSIILLILMFLRYVHQQKLTKISENRELTAKLEHEEKVKQFENRQRKLEKEKHEELLASKTREITSYSMLVSNKNHILKQIKFLNTQILNNKENTPKTVAKIEEIIQDNLKVDDEWKNFKMHFDKVHPDFFEKLKKICNDLTEENLKMCAYIKMRMTNKQIARLLQVVPKTVITARYRLKKKINLDETVDLDDFIAKM